MDDNNRQHLQNIRGVSDGTPSEDNSYLLNSPTAASIGATNVSLNQPVVDDILRLQLHQQNLLQREMSRSNVSESQPNDIPLSLLMRNNSSAHEQQFLHLQQQLRGRDNYDLSSLDSQAAMRGIGSLQQQRIDQILLGGSVLPRGNTNADQSIAMLMRNIQQQRNLENEQAERSQRHRELMLNAALSLQQRPEQRVDAGSININALLGESSGASRFSNLEQSRLQQLEREQAYSLYQNNSSTQNSSFLPTSNSSHLLSGANLNFGQYPVPSLSNLRNTGVTDQELDIGRQILIEEYLQSKQEDLRLMKQRNADYQKETMDDPFVSQNRLAYLVQQRQRLDQQTSTSSTAESLPVSRNISLKNDEIVDAKQSPVAKIRKFEAFIEKPKRPLSAYNIFFRQERQKLLSENDDENEGKVDSISGTTDTKEDEDAEDKKPAAVAAELLETKGTKRKRGKPHHKVTFEQMAKIIGQRWKDLESDETKKKYYQDIAQKDKERYQAELVAWKKQKNALSSKYRKKNDSNDD